MFSNYFKIAYRNLLRYKGYSMLSILGLSVGIAATILILLYVRFESGYDHFHANGDRIYRASFTMLKEGVNQGTSPQFVPPFGPAAKADIPEVQNYVRLSSPRVAYATMGGKSVKLNRIRYADSSFFDVFSFQLEAGNPARVLVNPYSIVLARSTAERIFGNENPVGRVLKLNGKDDYTVTGVAADPPPNSTIQFSALISFSTLYQDPNLFLGWNGGNQYVPYLLLTPQANPQSVEQQCQAVLWRNINQQYATVGLKIVAALQPMEDIHLWHDPASDTLRTNLTIFTIIAIFILTIACVNFVNLTTARAVRRAKEVGVRKSFGAERGDLIRQFLGEALLVSLVSCLFAIVIAALAMPWYRQFVGLAIPSVLTFDPAEVGMFLLLVLVVGMLAGGYPALSLSRFEVIRTLKGAVGGSSKSRIRDVLVTLQFTISIGLIVCTLFVNRQLDFMQDKDLGFHKDGMMVLSLRDQATRDRVDVLRQELSGLRGVTGVTASSEVPSAGFTSNGYIPEGRKSPMFIHVVDIDDQFLSTYGLTLVRGEGFSREKQSTSSGYIINQSLASTLGWTDPVGKHIARNGDHAIIGVVKDFHYASLREAIEPLIMTSRPWRTGFEVISVRFTSSDVAALVASIKEKWSAIVPGSPFEYTFIDDELNRLYGPEQHFQDLFASFSTLAIVLALVGLLGLASFAAEQRTKEIGVRKVLGASVPSVIGLLSREFVVLVLLANVVAWPVAYYFMNKWLEGYAYRIGMNWWVFAVSGISVLIIALVAVTVQTLRAASANPVDALRYE